MSFPRGFWQRCRRSRWRAASSQLQPGPRPRLRSRGSSELARWWIRPAAARRRCTGPLSNWRAAQMNAALDRNGSRVKFEVVFGDSKSNPAFAQSEALRLINQEQVKAFVADSSGVTIAINKLNYDPATSAKQKVPITCFQCSSSFINDANVTKSDPVTQAAERDVDNWLFRVFYVAKYEAAVLVQIALKKTAVAREMATAPSRSEFLPTAAIARWPPASPRSCRRSTRTRRPPRSSTCRRSTSSGRTGPR